jgi:hypothetical protein
MPDLTPAQSGRIDELIESYGEGQVTGWDDETGKAIFKAGDQNLLVDKDGEVTELPLPPSTGGETGGQVSPGAGMESSATPAAEDRQPGPESAGGLLSGPAASVSFPVDTLREAAIHFRRPFADAAVKWKVQAGTLVVPYIDARLVIERLNLVVPHLWHDEYEPLAGGKGLLCRLTIDGVTRLDVGEGYIGKGLYSDAFKRAAVKFGIGVSLYALPKVFLDRTKGQLKERKDKGGKVHLDITDKGKADLDAGYRRWLVEVGVPMFGDLLDHGDVYGSYGDVEAEAPVSAPVAEDAPADREPLTDAKAKAMVETARALWKGLPKDAKTKMPKAAFERQLAGASHSHEELEKFMTMLEAQGAAHA